MTGGQKTLGSSNGKTTLSKGANSGSNPDLGTIDKMNISRLMSYIKKHVMTMANNFLFNINTDRSQITNLMMSFLCDLQSRRALQNFSVVCDDSNNTPADIDNGMLNMNIYVQPNKAANFVSLNVIVFGGDILPVLVNLEAFRFKFSDSDPHSDMDAMVVGIVGINDGFVCDPSIPGVDAYFVMSCGRHYYVLYNMINQYVVYIDDEAISEIDAPHNLSCKYKGIFDCAINEYIREAC